MKLDDFIKLINLHGLYKSIRLFKFSYVIKDFGYRTYILNASLTILLN